MLTIVISLLVFLVLIILFLYLLGKNSENETIVSINTDIKEEILPIEEPDKDLDTAEPIDMFKPLYANLDIEKIPVIESQDQSKPFASLKTNNLIVEDTSSTQIDSQTKD